MNPEIWQKIFYGAIISFSVLIIFFQIGREYNKNPKWKKFFFWIGIILAAFIIICNTVNKHFSDISYEKLKNQVSARNLTKEQQEILIKELTPYRGKTVLFFSTSGNQEALEFAQQLRDVFKNAGWNLGNNVTPMIPGTGRGIYLHISSNTDIKDAEIVFNAFKKIDINLQVARMDTQNINQIQIFVAAK